MHTLRLLLPIPVLFYRSPSRFSHLSSLLFLSSFHFSYFSRSLYSQGTALKYTERCPLLPSRDPCVPTYLTLSPATPSNYPVSFLFQCPRFIPPTYPWWQFFAASVAWFFIDPSCDSHHLLSPSRNFPMSVHSIRL